MGDLRRLKVEPFHIWRHRVTLIAGVEDADLYRVIGGMRQLDRILMWYRDDMTAEMAGASLGAMTRDAIRYARNTRESDYLRTLVRVK